MKEVIAVRSYRPEDAAAFRDINLDWIGRYFVIEAKDRETLDNPQTAILDKGGAILVAEADGVVIGVVALVPYAPGVLELAKMGVAPAAQGLGAGRRLVAAAVNLARTMNAERVYLETNSRLAPAINIYRKAGFAELPPRPTPYARADVFMELRL
jgi:ribosomal protein S18 acetylase RimI-like enzyme